VANPFRRIAYDESALTAGYLEEIAPQLGVAIGLAVRRLGD